MACRSLTLRSTSCTTRTCSSIWIGNSSAASSASAAECSNAGGILRIVVPDLETLARDYVTSLPSDGNSTEACLRGHERAVERLLEQLVREEPFGASEQARIVRTIERVVRGDARRTGELHRWMYDRYTLQGVLRNAGFSDVTVRSDSTSGVPDWQRFGLDVNPDGSAYIDHSLYVEASR